MDEILLDTSPQPERPLEHNLKALQDTLVANTADIRKRNEALAFRVSPAKVSAKLSAAVARVKVLVPFFVNSPINLSQLLNSLSRDSQLPTVFYFDQEPGDSFSEKLDMLLTWSVTPLQYGDHRPLAAVTLIQQWCNRAYERATRRGSQHPHELLQDHLFDWLDTSPVAGEEVNIQAVSLLYGKLVKLELFSYPNYIQRLIARGERGLSYSEVCLPVFVIA